MRKTFLAFKIIPRSSKITWLPLTHRENITICAPLPLSEKYLKTDHICILGIGLELACKVGSYGGIRHLSFEKTPRNRLSSCPVPIPVEYFRAEKCTAQDCAAFCASPVALLAGSGYLFTSCNGLQCWKQRRTVIRYARMSLGWFIYTWASMTFFRHFMVKKTSFPLPAERLSSLYMQWVAYKRTI